MLGEDPLREQTPPPKTCATGLARRKLLPSFLITNVIVYICVFMCPLPFVRSGMFEGLPNQGEKKRLSFS